MARIVTVSVLVLVATVWAGSPVRADNKPEHSVELPKAAIEVGTTKDASDKGNTVEFDIVGGKTAKVAANQTGVFELQDVTKEITWYSVKDGKRTRERSANDSNFNYVKISRSETGAISWTFYRVK